MGKGLSACLYQPLCAGGGMVDVSKKGLSRMAPTERSRMAHAGSNPAPRNQQRRAKMKYRKKPVVIEAVQWTGDNLLAVINFTGLHESAARWSWGGYEQVVSEKGLKIFTDEGPLMAAVGDWIIKGIKGEFYPCKPDIFEATYEPV